MFLVASAVLGELGPVSQRLELKPRVSREGTHLYLKYTSGFMGFDAQRSFPTTV